MKCLAVIAIATIALATAEVYFEEDFSGDWESRWVQSKTKDGLGVMKVSAGKFHGDVEAGKGLQTSQDASSMLSPPKPRSSRTRARLSSFSTA